MKKFTIIGFILLFVSASLLAQVDADIPNKQHIAEDLTVAGSIGLGYDMPSSGYAFGYSTIAMVENNLRILFTDNSASASFLAVTLQVL